MVELSYPKRILVWCIFLMHNFSWQRAVLKVGSSLIAPGGSQQGCSAQYLLSIAKFITTALAQGKEIILVSSGSVAAGRASITIKHAPSIAEKQAMAAIGQTQMMQNWARFFDQPCAQVLLTMDDLHDRQRYVNIQNTLRELLAHKAIPIVNENDTVAINELKVGDNDNLAAYTAMVAQADTCIICSDIDGLFTANPRTDASAELLTCVSDITPEIKAMAGGAGSAVGTGGMLTKIEAAERCTQTGIQMLVVNGQSAATFDALAAGKCPGTLFTPKSGSVKARMEWLQYTLHSKGALHIDTGAHTALIHKGASLLPIGVVSVSGEFKAGDAVNIVFDGNVIAKGLCQYDYNEATTIAGCKSDAISAKLGYTLSDVLVHRDNLVIL